MLAGSTADRIGRRFTFQTGLVVFSLGSLLCALAPSLGFLIAARVSCRRSAARCSTRSRCRSSATCSRIPASGRRRSASGGRCSGSASPSARSSAALLVDSIGWRVGVPRQPAGRTRRDRRSPRMYVPESRAPHPRRIDPVGQALMIVALATLTYAIIEGRRAGLAVGRDPHLVRRLACQLRRADRLRAAPPRAAARGPLLPQRAVLGRERDRASACSPRSAAFCS